MGMSMPLLLLAVSLFSLVYTFFLYIKRIFVHSHIVLYRKVFGSGFVIFMILFELSVIHNTCYIFNQLKIKERNAVTCVFKS